MDFAGGVRAGERAACKRDVPGPYFTRELHDRGSAPMVAAYGCVVLEATKPYWAFGKWSTSFFARTSLARSRERGAPERGAGAHLWDATVKARISTQLSGA